MTLQQTKDLDAFNLSCSISNIRSLLSTLDSLRAEVEALRADALDAKRYRWLRDLGCTSLCARDIHNRPVLGERLDSAVDKTERAQSALDDDIAGARHE